MIIHSSNSFISLNPDQNGKSSLNGTIMISPPPSFSSSSFFFCFLIIRDGSEIQEARLQNPFVL